MTTVLDKLMTREQFNALVEDTFRVMTETGLPQSREQLGKDLISRLAQKNGMSVEEAEKMLDSSEEPIPEPEPEPEKRRKKVDVGEATKSIRELTTKGVYFYESPEEAAFIDTIVALNRSAGLAANLLVTGPSGCGKSESIGYAAKRAGVAFYKIDCASITSDEKWIGHKEFSTETGTVYVLSEFLRALSATDCEPGIVLLDEINRLHPTRVNILFPLLDGSGSIWVPELGITINKHPDTIFMATANKGVGFTGTHKMDDALEGRFAYRLERTWPTAAQEATILVKRTGIDPDDAKVMVSIAEETRKKAKADDLPLPVSTRDLLFTAALVAAGMTIPQAAEWTFVKFYDDSGGAGAPRAMVRTIIQGKAVPKVAVSPPKAKA